MPKFKTTVTLYHDGLEYADIPVYVEYENANGEILISRVTALENVPFMNPVNGRDYLPPYFVKQGDSIDLTDKEFQDISNEIEENLSLDRREFTEPE